MNTTAMNTGYDVFMSNGALIGGTAGILAAAGAFAYAVRGRSSRVFGPSVYHGERRRPALALTFDDGPSESTPELLKILARHGVPATFFMCGENVQRLPAIAGEVASAGHEIGNHTHSHPRLDFRAPGFIYREMAQAQETIQRHTNRTPRLFRAPYGVRWFGVRSAQHRLDLLGVMWSVIAHDWRWPAARIERLLVDRPRNGDIICLHDGRRTEHAPDIGATLQAVQSAIPRLQERGFRFETVSQILCPTK